QSDKEEDKTDAEKSTEAVKPEDKAGVEGQAETTQPEDKAGVEGQAETTQPEDKAGTQGQADTSKPEVSQDTVQQSHDRLNDVVKQAEQVGLKVKVENHQIVPDYQDYAGLKGQALTDAIGKNTALYQEALQKAYDSSEHEKDKLALLLADYQDKMKAYEEAQNQRDQTIKQGQSDLETSTQKVDEQIQEAQKQNVPVQVKQDALKPEYVPVKGLSGEQLVQAMQKNIELYKQTIAQAVQRQDASVQVMKDKLSAYQKALADYQAGVANASTGLKWTNNTNVTAGDGAEAMSGGEVVTDFPDPSLKEAARVAIQGDQYNQNQDANFDHIFKINGTGSVVVHDTTNGDVTLTFSDIKAPANSGTYVAIWGADDGGLAWGVFATYNGQATGGAGEGGAGGSTISGGNILDYVYSYHLKMATSNPVSVFSLNDIDNNQTFTINNIQGKVTFGSNIIQEGNSFTAGSGDVSEGSNGQLGSNGLRYELDTPQIVTVDLDINTSDRNDTSIVGGAFGSSSELPKEPEMPELIAEKLTVEVPEEGDKPEAPSAIVYVDDVTPAPETPAPEIPAPETPAPEAPKLVQPVASLPVKENVLPQTGETSKKSDNTLALSVVAGLGAFALLAISSALKSKKN
ncbi:hypothetical protein, partial [Fructobacillus tropaeoli]|uniref:hypothetical protein n=1 Tax=Fructobacillus tropaeoli TaxID=709323 RepID=UPI0030C8C4AC